MAVLTGVIAHSVSQAGPSPSLAGALGNFEVDYHPPHEMELAAGPTGGLTSNRPVSANPRVLSGNVAFGPGTDIFCSVNFLPDPLNLGYLTETLTYPLKLWNAFEAEVEVTGVSVSGVDGIVVDLPLGTTLSPQEVLVVDMLVSIFGNWDVDSEITITFDVGGTSHAYTLHVTGERAVVWPAGPNWESPLIVADAFKTSVVKSRSGREQRQAARHNPRVTFDFTTVNDDAAARDIGVILAGAQNRTMVVADYSTGMRVISPVGEGDLVLQLESPDHGILVGDQVILSDIAGNASRYVGDVDGPAITLVAGTTRAFDAATMLYRAFPGRLPQMTASALSARLMQSPVQFQINPPSTPPLETEPLATYNGYELLLIKPNRVSPISIDRSWETDTIDFGRGSIAHFPVIEFPEAVHRATYLRASRSDVQLLRDFFARMKGQRGEFYAPTWTDDLRAASGLTSGFATLTVATGGLTRFMSGSTVYRHVAVVLRSGVVLSNRIGSMLEVGGVTELTMTNPWATTVAQADIAMVCWLPRRAFATDILSMQWLNGHMANVTLAMRTLEDL